MKFDNIPQDNNPPTMPAPPDEQPQETIADAIKRGNVPCPQCRAPIPVAQNGQVAIPCAACGYGSGDEMYWNLMVQKN